MKRIAARTQKSLLPLFAVGGSLAALPAQALELGDVTVQSRLGQPLRASIAFALAPNEEVAASCVTLGRGAPASGLPGIGRATLSIADGAILLTGTRPIREPLVAASINIACPYTVKLNREYLMFIDPVTAGVSSEPASRTATVVDSTAATVAPRTTTRPTRATRDEDRSPIGQTSRYRVQPGDTLSQIVQRIENRSTRLWPAVNAIFDANPDAFINNDPNKLKAGSWLTIPSFLGGQSVSPVADTGATPANDAVAAAAAEAASTEATTGVPTANSADVGSTASATTTADSTVDLSPADGTPISDNPFVDGQPTDYTVVIPDTELEGPETVSASPNVTTAVVSTDTGATTSSPSWLMWLAGSGIALIIAMLLFGRLFRGRPDDAEAVVLASTPQRRASDHEPRVLPDDSGIEVITHSDYTIDDDSPTAENVALDADLVLGTGLDSSTEMEVAEDFGFASPTELDIELPFEPEPSVPKSDTGIFASEDADTAAFEKGDFVDEDDYDLSIVLDATKMPRPEESTHRDLQAVEVEPVQDIAKTDSYTIESELDLEILEQDYEDELTATQALNAELARAAEEVTAQSESGDFDVTSEMPAAPTSNLTESNVTEIDATAEMPTGSDETVEMPSSGEDATVEMPSADKAKSDDETGIHEAATVEMPAAENDETANMEVEGGTIDTKAL